MVIEIEIEICPTLLYPLLPALCVQGANNAAELIRRTQIEALSHLLIDQSSNPLNVDTILSCLM